MKYIKAILFLLVALHVKTQTCNIRDVMFKNKGYKNLIAHFPNGICLRSVA